MFSAPLRLLRSVRSDVPAAILTATAVSTVVFIATPFLIHPLATQWDVSPGLVGVVSTLQLLGFVFASWLAPRWFYPRRKVMSAAIAIGVGANLASAAAPDLAWLAITRFGSGIALGLIAWVSWAEVFGDDERVGDVAVVGPAVGIVAAPAIAGLVDVTSPQVLFVVLAALFLIPAAFTHQMRLTTTPRSKADRHAPTRAALAVLIALGLLTIGGSSIFTYAADIGQRFDGLSAVGAALAYSLNSLASIPAARYRGPRVMPGFWLLGCAACALLIGTVLHPAALFVGVGLWGFFYWRGVPGAFSILARRSAFPDERAGDAQAVMAFGRVIGPTIGGVIYAVGPNPLGIVAATIMATSAAALVYVEWRVQPTAIRFNTRSDPAAS